MKLPRPRFLQFAASAAAALPAVSPFLGTRLIRFRSSSLIKINLKGRVVV
jgi:hypothetical protein